MALIRVNPPVQFSVDHDTHLRGLVPWRSKFWERKGKIRAIKDHVRRHLLTVQDEKCCYCGLRLNLTSGSRIDHVAPKGLYAQFTFEPSNLVLSCQFCNEELKKQYDPIITPVGHGYQNCSFRIVHPVLDDPERHILKRFFSVKGITQKGIESIKLFDLTAERRIRARHVESLSDRADAISHPLQQLFRRIRDYTPR